MRRRPAGCETREEADRRGEEVELWGCGLCACLDVCVMVGLVALFLSFRDACLLACLLPLSCCHAQSTRLALIPSPASALSASCVCLVLVCFVFVFVLRSGCVVCCLCAEEALTCPVLKSHGDTPLWIAVVYLFVCLLMFGGS
mmetsp:Transcript_41681/g.83548  ORF Transcript_41681/g.83548 Transcript_41681/m.83548 type:complete len:143 (-) Transcript_41681:11-439(-)